MTQSTVEQTQVKGDQIKVGDIQNGESIAIGQRSSVVHVDALGDVGDVITGTKISLVNRDAAQRVASKRQVSAPPADYIERVEEEGALSALLTAEHEGFHAVYLYGLPGAGKSWLARKVATALEDTFIDGILWADLETTNIRTAVWNFIEPFDVTISRTSLRSLGEFAAAMHAAFADQCILIVLDNANKWQDNWQELRSWLPDKSPHCRVLIIAHQPPPKLHENESSYRLGGLKKGEAVKLFTRLLHSDERSVEYDEEIMLALAEKLDYLPKAIRTIARDINVKLVAPSDCLEFLATQRVENGGSPHTQGLETVFQGLPKEGRALFPYLGILRNVPWTADDLFPISLKTNREIEMGLAQLQRAGLLESQESGSYKTPMTISEFALHKLGELGGQPFIDATMSLRSADILRKAGIILRYSRQSLLGECWRDHKTRKVMIDSVSKQFSSSVATSIRKSEDTNLFALRLDPLKDFFEDYILTHHEYVQQWLDILEASDFPVISHQLEDVFDWAVSREDWPLVRRFSSRIGVNCSWMVNTQLNGIMGRNNWTPFGFVFTLLKNITATNAELLRIKLKGSNIKSTTWEDCKFVDVKWPGAHVISSTFSGIDMVGMVMPASVATGCTFTDVDARYGDFRGTIFQQCQFHDINFHGAQLENTKFIDCYYSKVNFRSTVIEDSYRKFCK